MLAQPTASASKSVKNSDSISQICTSIGLMHRVYHSPQTRDNSPVPRVGWLGIRLKSQLRRTRFFQPCAALRRKTAWYGCAGAGSPFTRDTGIEENVRPVIRFRLASSSSFDLNRKRVITVAVFWPIGFLRSLKSAANAVLLSRCCARWGAHIVFNGLRELSLLLLPTPDWRIKH